jgi:hypothetical protein
MPDILKSLRFNGYAYQSLIDWPATFTDGKQVTLRTSQPPNVPGAFTSGGLAGARKPSIKGSLTVPGTGNVQADLLSLRSAWDNFSAVHAPGMPGLLFLDSDRYLKAEVAGVSDTEWNGLLRRDYEVQFFCGDPFWYQGADYAPASNTAALAIGAASPPTADTSNGLSAPVDAPALTAADAGTALAAGTYTVAYSYATDYGETLLSPTATITITAGQKITVAAIALPTGAASIGLYLSTAANSPTLAYAASTDGGAAVDLSALPAAGSTAVTVNGTAPSLPIFTFSVTAAPAGGRIMLTTQDGQSFTIMPDTAGTWTVDCSQAQEIVSLAGADRTAVFAGEFPRLAAGDNALRLGLAGGVTLSAASVTWQDRWY